MTTILSILDISTSEEQIFKVLASLGIASATDISKGCGIKRTSVYLYLDNLQKKGLVLESLRKSKKFYQITNLKGLDQLLKSKQLELKKLQKSLPSIISELESKKMKKDGGITFYHSMNTIISLLEDAANSNTELYFLGSTKGLFKKVSPELINDLYTKKRRKNFHNDYMISDWSKATVKRFKEESDMWTRRRFLPPGLPETGCVIIFKNKLAIVKVEPELQVVIIEDQTIVEVLKLSYMSLWKELEGKNLPA